MFIDRFCRTDFSSYEEFKREFKINVPEHFNFGYDVVDELAAIRPDSLAFIWCNSLESAMASRGKSLIVLNFLEPYLEIFVGQGNVTQHLVRKIAHFCEFAVLGCGVALLRRRRGWQPVLNCLAVGLAAAVTDESLQLLSQRGAQVQDILLDFVGFLCGLGLVLLITTLFRRPR